MVDTRVLAVVGAALLALMTHTLRRRRRADDVALVPAAAIGGGYEPTDGGYGSVSGGCSTNGGCRVDDVLRHFAPDTRSDDAMVTNKLAAVHAVRHQSAAHASDAVSASARTTTAAAVATEASVAVALPALRTLQGAVVGAWLLWYIAASYGIVDSAAARHVLWWSVFIANAAVLELAWRLACAAAVAQARPPPFTSAAADVSGYAVDDLDDSDESPPFVDLTGRWIKDGERSGSMEAMVSVMQLNGIVRAAVKLVRGLEIAHTRDTFDMAVFSAIPLLKVRESYPTTGEERCYKRRDLRRGLHTAHVQPTSTGLRLFVRWGEPFSGFGYDDFELLSDNELRVTSHLCSQGKKVVNATLYRRAGSF